MKKDFRPMLSEIQLENMERLCGRTYHVKSVFSSYRQLVLVVKVAGRSGDKEAYDKACKKLEGDRERIDWCIGHKLA